MDVLVCVAAPVERGRLEDRFAVAGHDVRVLETGIGPVRAAHAVTRELARQPAGAVVSLGVGGAYPGSGLAVGDVACARTETFGDLGAETDGGFANVFPDLTAPLPLDLALAEPRVPFVTVMTCTGTDARAQALAARTGGAVESMEGAAVAYVARQFGAPCGGLRGISNPVGRRDRAAWKIEEAADAAQQALLRWLESLPC